MTRTWLLSCLLGLLLVGCPGETETPDAGDDDAGADTAVIGDTSVSGDTGLADTGAGPCGDSTVEGSELCDGDDVACVDLGEHYLGGMASCRSDCRGYDVSTCMNRPLRWWEIVKPSERDARWSNARCNDGTPFDFAYRPGAPGSKVWVIYFQGGGFGDDVAFPTAAREAALTSTTTFADRTRGPVPLIEHGIFGGPTINPDFHEAHMVLVRYCSSDLYTGRGVDRRPVDGIPEGYYFAGRHNVRAMTEILAQRYGLDDSDAALEVMWGRSERGVHRIDANRGHRRRRAAHRGPPRNAFACSPTAPMSSRRPKIKPISFGGRRAFPTSSCSTLRWTIGTRSRCRRARRANRASATSGRRGTRRSPAR